MHTPKVLDSTIVFRTECRASIYFTPHLSPQMIYIITNIKIMSLRAWKPENGEIKNFTHKATPYIAHIRKMSMNRKSPNPDGNSQGTSVIGFCYW